MEYTYGQEIEVDITDAQLVVLLHDLDQSEPKARFYFPKEAALIHLEVLKVVRTRERRYVVGIVRQIYG